jgi:hypothetical protein
MKTKKPSEKDPVVVYRKDGKTPDLRYKSSRVYIFAQQTGKDKEQKKDWKTSGVRYTGLRDHVLSQQTAKPRDIPAQIKPAGKKPVWKISG